MCAVLGEHLLADTGDLSGQLAVALGSLGQRDEDQRDPLVAERVESLTGPALGNRSCRYACRVRAAVPRSWWALPISLVSYALVGAFFPTGSSPPSSTTRADWRQLRA